MRLQLLHGLVWALFLSIPALAIVGITYLVTFSPWESPEAEPFHGKRPVWVGSFEEDGTICYYTGKGISCVRR